MEKRFNIQVFDSDADFKGTVSQDKIKNKISFEEEVNGGQRQLVLSLAYDFDDFPDFLTPFNFIRVFAVTTENPKGILIYSGWISQITPFISDRNEGVEVVAMGLATMLNLSLYKDGSNFDVTETSFDPKTAVDNVIAHHQSEYPPTSGNEWVGTNAVSENGIPIRAGGNVDTVGTTIDSFTFQKQRWFGAMQKCLELSGLDWYWKVDKGGDVFFKQKPASATHIFTIDKDVQRLKAPQNIENIINDVTVEYDVGTSQDSDATSITNYGRRERYINESTSSQSGSAGEIAAQKIAENKEPKIAVELTVNDEYDIESIQAGDSCTIQNYKKDATILNENMFIVSMKYQQDKVVLRLEQKGLDFGGSLLAFVQEKS